MTAPLDCWRRQVRILDSLVGRWQRARVPRGAADWPDLYGRYSALIAALADTGIAEAPRAEKPEGVPRRGALAPPLTTPPPRIDRTGASPTRSQACDTADLAQGVQAPGAWNRGWPEANAALEALGTLPQAGATLNRKASASAGLFAADTRSASESASDTDSRGPAALTLFEPDSSAAFLQRETGRPSGTGQYSAGPDASAQDWRAVQEGLDSAHPERRADSAADQGTEARRHRSRRAMLPQRLAGQIGRDGAKVTTFPLSTSALARLLSQEVERPAPEPRAAEAKAAEVMPGPLPTLTDTDPLPPAAYRARPTDLLPNLEDGPTATFTAPALSGRTSAPEIDALYDALAERLAEEFRAAYGTGAI